MVLVTGGTGLVGSHLLLRLLQDNIRVRAIYREGSNLKWVEKVFWYYTQNAAELFSQIEWVKADLNDIPALEASFLNIEVVYHTAAFISFDPRRYKKLQKINTEGTANIVNLCLAKKIKKLCYVSTIGTIGKSMNGTMANEDSEWIERDTNVYAITKHAAEIEVWRGIQEGLAAVIVNPGVIVGPGFWGKGSGELFTIANKGYTYYPPGGTGFVSVNDVVKIMRYLTDSAQKNERFILVDKNLKFQEILSLIAKELGKSQPTKQLKYWQLQIGRSIDWAVNIFTGRGRRITKSSIKSLQDRDLYANDKIKNVLPFEFEPLSEVIRFCSQKFKEENP
ncbi:MAG: NAD-dependent epimerase/dehydratase family protein [Maribacter sp.]|nr:NAD-dependent epimerase/dehydratase family protein [Maribacter sp.]